MKDLIIRVVLLTSLLMYPGCSTRDQAAVGMGLGILSLLESGASDAKQDKKMLELEREIARLKVEGQQEAEQK